MTLPDRPTTFLTGATGFLGQFLLRELLQRGRRVVVLLRPPAGDALRRLTALMHPLGVELERRIAAGDVVTVTGAIPDALPTPDWGRTDDVVHSAACLQLFQNGNAEPWKTNVDGVRALLAWADQHSIQRIHAVSTAYVCGMNGDCIREVLHDEPVGFQTDYERSKWQAERILATWAAAAPGRSLTIYRPSFVVGDSDTGYTTQFGGFYQLARMVGMLKNHGQNGHGDDYYVALRIPLNPEARHNVVPVDFAARLIAAAVVDESTHGRIYHVVDPAPPTNDFWKSCFEEYFHLHGGYFVDSRHSNGAQSEAEAMLWEQLDVLVPRLRHTPAFDTTHAQALMRKAGLQYPALDRKRALRLLDYAARSGWGKRLNGHARGKQAARARLAGDPHSRSLDAPVMPALPFE